MLNNIFVYGTLMEGKWNDGPFYQKHRISVRKGIISGRVYAVASFPGVKLNAETEKDVVFGEVHSYPLECMSQILKSCDSLEGYSEGRAESSNHYNRRIVTVTLESGQEVQAYVYEYSRPVREDIRILSNQWTENSLNEVHERNVKSMTAGKKTR